MEDESALTTLRPVRRSVIDGANGDGGRDTVAGDERAGLSPDSASRMTLVHHQLVQVIRRASSMGDLIADERAEARDYGVRLSARARTSSLGSSRRMAFSSMSAVTISGRPPSR